MLKDNRIKVIIGHYGSGKTEFAVNYAIKLAKEGKKVALGDLDIVNVYFRSREKQEMLESLGITLVASSVKGSSNSDLPAMSAAILGPLQNESYEVVLDVGGDAAGARALGRYRSYLQPGKYDMFCVLNANRPGTQDVKGAIQHIKSIEGVVRAPITGLINNTHLLRETTPEVILSGHELVKEVSKRLNIPIRYVSALEKVAQLLPVDMEGQIFPMKMHMREDWM